MAGATRGLRKDIKCVVENLYMHTDLSYSLLPRVCCLSPCNVQQKRAKTAGAQEESHLVTTCEQRRKQERMLPGKLLLIRDSSEQQLSMARLDKIGTNETKCL